MPDTGSQLKRVRTIATMLDSAIKVPGTSMRFGLDPIIGLIPGLGDIASAAMSGYIVLSGIRLGASRPVVMRMIANVALDTIVGAVPLFGDLFDAGWKSNNRNVALLEKHFAVETQQRKGSALTLAAAIGALAVLAIGGGILTFYFVRWLIHFFQ